MALLEIENLSFTYSGTDQAALDRITLDIEEGEFVLLCGESGCGKTTLLRLLKKELRPSGALDGKIRYAGKDLDQLDERTLASEIGYVMQSPDRQIVTDKVWHELAFGLESLGEDSAVIRRRVSEIVGFFGIGDLYHKKTCELSGGQKQLLNLASIMVMRPKILLLDEPTAQLDPIAASEFIASLKKLHEELGMTVILVEHRLEEVFPIATKVVLMDHAEIFAVDTPRGLGARLMVRQEHRMYSALPTAVRLFHALQVGGECPLTVREGRRYITEHFKNEKNRLIRAEGKQEAKEIALSVKGAYFRYERNASDVLKGLDLTVYRGEFLAVMGGNGVGKTTLLRLIGGIRKPYRGKVTVFPNKTSGDKKEAKRRSLTAILPQDPQSVFVRSSVYEDLLDMTEILGIKKESGKEAIASLAEQLEITHLLDRHPYDLSGGEAQKAAFAKLLLTEPEIILLDEPTKGLDPYAKKQLASLLLSMKAQGKTIVMITHDVEFAAEYADRAAMFFDGRIVSVSPIFDFFAENNYYTTAAARMTKPYYLGTVTLDSVVALCRENGRKEENHAG